MFLSSIADWFAGKPAAHDNKFRPRVEGLDERLVPASVSVSQGNLVIQGTNAVDKVRVEAVINGFRVTDNSGKTPVVKTFTASQVHAGNVYFYGYGGNDTFGNYADNLSTFADGGDGNDLLGGAGKGDILMGMAGNDVLDGAGGGDALFGDGGNDKLFGGAGNDSLDGGALGEKDTLEGGAGADRFVRDLRRVAGGTTVNLDEPTDYRINGDIFVDPNVPAFQNALKAVRKFSYR